jgi:hypothetical protein
MNELGTYLNDHLAGSVAAIELLDHLIKEQSGQRLEKFLVDLREDVTADQETLRDLIRKLGGEEGALRKAGAWIVEKLGQVKIGASGDQINGLGLFQALEVLALGIKGKELLWRSLTAVEASLPQLQGLDLAQLERRAKEQFERVENERLHLTHEVFLNAD